MTLKHQAVINQLTLEEKASLLSGANFWNTKPIERLGIPSIMLTDGPHGLRKQGGKADHLGLNASIPATCFPTAITLGSSWDVDLVQRVGRAIGTEAAAENVSVVLGPGLNIIRNPLGGRTFEYFSEDPYLTGKIAAASVKGIQSTGVAATPKHFAVNSQELLRMSIDEVVDERSMREIYLEGFRRVVEEAKPRLIMSSYNRVNGVLANESTHLLNDILKKEWGFNGVVVTDWGGEGDRIAGLKAGNQLEMPSTNGLTDKEIVTAVQNKTIDPLLLDSSVDTLLELIKTSVDTRNKNKDAALVDHTAHHELAIEAARQSLVLLKNDNATLPLQSGTEVAVIGDFAKQARYQGAGSSLIHPTKLSHALDAIANSPLKMVGYAPGFHRNGKKSRQLQREAIGLARKAQTVLLFLGLDESSEAEGLDRTTMQLPEVQLALVKEILTVNKKIIIVLAGGGPVELPFADEVPAIIHTQLAGQGGGEAIVDIITGAVTPSGKLTVSYPLTYSDVPSAQYFPGKELTAEHREGIYVGYRYYDTANVDVRYPFGHGLSYTTFKYSETHVSQQEVSVTITNTGQVEGSEVVQVYVQPQAPLATFRAQQELKGFAKITLQPGESKTVTIPFDNHSFAFYHIAQKAWVIAPGDYTIAVGSSSRDIRSTAMLAISGEALEDPYKKDILEVYYTGAIQNVSDKAFATLLGHKPPQAKWDRRAPLTNQDTIRQLRYSNVLGKAIYGSIIVARKTLFVFNKPLQANNLMFIIDMPLYKLERFTGGSISQTKIRRFLKLVNLGRRKT